MEPIYNWDSENNIATCTIMDKAGRKFVGTAKCHPDDIPFANQYTGSHIAFNRAFILYLKSIKRDILQPELRALKQLYYSMNQSKNFNPNSYENKMLWRQIRMKELDLATIEEELATQEQNLTFFIEEKTKLYNKLSAARKRAQKVNLE